MEYIDPEFIISHVLNKNQQDKYSTLTKPLNYSNQILNSVDLSNYSNGNNVNNLNQTNKTDSLKFNEANLNKPETNQTKLNSINPNTQLESSNSVTSTKNNITDSPQTNDIYLTSSNIIIILVVVVIVLFVLLMIALYKLYQTKTKLTKIKNKYSMLKLKTQTV